MARYKSVESGKDSIKGQDDCQEGIKRGDGTKEEYWNNSAEEVEVEKKEEASFSKNEDNREVLGGTEDEVEVEVGEEHPDEEEKLIKHYIVRNINFAIRSKTILPSMPRTKFMIVERLKVGKNKDNKNFQLRVGGRGFE